MRSINPLALENHVDYDARDRVVRNIQNATASHPADMLVSEQSYTPDGALEILTLKNEVTGDQVTRWIYGTTLADSEIATSSLLAAKIYPDNPLSLDPASSGGGDCVEYQYNRLGETIGITDQTGTFRDFKYDARGRQTHDEVATLGSGVDGAVRCVTTSYDSLDRRTLVTSWPNVAATGTPINQVGFTYNDFGQLNEDKQEHEGAVDGSTLKVSYLHNTGSDNNLALQQTTYPGGKVIQMLYGFADESALLPRPLGILDGTTFEGITSYAYLGVGQIVATTYQQPGVYLLHKGAASGNIPSDSGPHDPYVGLDRFGRVIDQRWCDNSLADLERIQYGYDAGSRRTWRRQAAAPGLGQDEAYQYDGLSQVTQRQRGDLNLAATAIGSEVAGEAFDYDPTGNWQEYRAWAGSEELIQPRTFNEANELVTFDGSGAVIAYDAAGRMTVVPAGETPEDGTWQLVWDAWSRLVEVNRMMDSEVASSTRHQYDGLFRRTRSINVEAPEETRDYYYNQSWKVIEERVESALGDYADVWVYGIRGRNDVICRDRTEGEVTTRHYALSDAMGSVTAIVDDAGAVHERYAYSAFGMSRVMDADFAPLTTSAHDWQIRFHGETRDAATGWYNYGFRYYLPELGRWPSRDPIGEEGGSNLYAFVANDSVNQWDYLGEKILDFPYRVLAWHAISQVVIAFQVTIIACCPKGTDIEPENVGLPEVTELEPIAREMPCPDGKLISYRSLTAGVGNGEARIPFSIYSQAEFDHMIENPEVVVDGFQSKFIRSLAEKVAESRAKSDAMEAAFFDAKISLPEACVLLAKGVKAEAGGRPRTTSNLVISKIIK